MLAKKGLSKCYLWGLGVGRKGLGGLGGRIYTPHLFAMTPEHYLLSLGIVLAKRRYIIMFLVLFSSLSKGVPV